MIKSLGLGKLIKFYQKLRRIKINFIYILIKIQKKFI